VKAYFVVELLALLPALDAALLAMAAESIALLAEAAALLADILASAAAALTSLIAAFIALSVATTLFAGVVLVQAASPRAVTAIMVRVIFFTDIFL
jgi:hypothetical protein